MDASVIGIVVVGLLSMLGTIYSARSARRTNTATVDVRIFELLQQDVVQLQSRVDQLREQLHKAQDESDRERNQRRRMEAELAAISDVVERMVRAMKAAQLPVPDGVDTYIRYTQPHKGI